MIEKSTFSLHHLFINPLRFLLGFSDITNSEMSQQKRSVKKLWEGLNAGLKSIYGGPSPRAMV